MKAGPTLTALQRLVREQFGIVYGDGQLATLEYKLTGILPALALESLEALRFQLERPTPPLATRVVEALTIGETYFFRNQAQFDALRDIFEPVLRTATPPPTPLVIWSAGCATGEEPFSIAMWFREHAPWIGPDRLQIIASDLNPTFLERAARGEYREWSFRRTPDSLRRRFFTSREGHWRLDPSVAAYVRFQAHNLAGGQLPGGMLPGAVDLVFCRNVLIYFDPPGTAKVLDLFRLALRPGAVLMLGHAESFAGVRARWDRSYSPGTFYFRARPVTAPASPVPAPAWPRVKASAPGAPRPPRPAETPARPQPALRREVRPNPPPDPPPTAQAPQHPSGLAQAKAAANAGQLAEALTALEAHVAREPTDLEAQLLAALVAEELGALDQARQALKAVLFLDKGLAIGHYLLAALQERHGATAAARRGYRTVERLLTAVADDVEVPFGDGLTAGLLRELTRSRLLEFEGGATMRREGTHDR